MMQTPEKHAERPSMINIVGAAGKTDDYEYLVALSKSRKYAAIAAEVMAARVSRKYSKEFPAIEFRVWGGSEENEGVLFDFGTSISIPAPGAEDLPAMEATSQAIRMAARLAVVKGWLAVRIETSAGGERFADDIEILKSSLDAVGIRVEPKPSSQVQKKNFEILNFWETPFWIGVENPTIAQAMKDMATFIPLEKAAMPANGMKAPA